MNQKIGKLLSLLTVFVMCLGAVPITASAAAIDYSPAMAGAAIIPKSMADDNNFMKKTVLNGDNPMNITNHFSQKSATHTTTSGGNGNRLSSALSFKHDSNNSWNVEYEWQIADKSPIQTLMHNGQIHIGLKAALTPDKHSNLRHWSKITDYAQANLITYLYGGINQTNRNILHLQNSREDGDGIARVYSGMGFANAPNGQSGGVSFPQSLTAVRFTAGSTNCSCGSSVVSNPYIYLVDATAPTIKEVYPSNANGDKTDGDAYIKAGSKGYLTLEMSEYVRFADHNPDKDLTVTFGLFSRFGKQSIDKTITAKLIKLVNEKLIFEFEPPSDGDYIATTLPANQAWMAGEYDRVLLNNNGESVSISGEASKVKSAITDLAGNALEWNSNIDFSYKIYTDANTPRPVSQSLSGSMIDSNMQYTSQDNWPADIDRSSVFAGVGDTLSFTLGFDDELISLVTESGEEKKVHLDEYLTSSYFLYLFPITATLNLLDENGNAVKVQADRRVLYENKSATYLSFNNVVIKEGYSTSDGNPIQITSLSFSTPAGDMSENMMPMNIENIGCPPKQKIYLDTQPPVVEEQMPASKEQDGSVIVTIPFTVEDVVQQGETDASGCTNLEASFAADIGGGYSYAITNSADIPEAWTESDGSAANFTSLDGIQQYLHLKIDDSTARLDTATGNIKGTVTIATRDYAGNSGSKTIEIMNAKLDKTKPEISFGESAFVTDKKLSAQVSVSDSSQLKRITYQWDNAQPVDVSGLNGTSLAFTATDGPASGEGTATLSVTAIDAADNSITQTYSYEYDFTMQTNSYTIACDTSKVINNPDLTVYPPQAKNNAAYITAVFVKKRGDNKYFYFDVTSNNTASKNIFEDMPAIYFDSLSITDEQIEVGKLYANDNHYGAMLGNCNGVIEVMLVTFPNEGWNPYDETKNKIILDSTASNVDTITFKVSKSPSVSLSLGTPKNPNGTDAQNYTYPSDKNQNALKTITGLSIPITIQNTSSEEIGLDAINFEDANSYAQLEKWDGENWTPVEHTKMLLSKTPEQNYVISVPLYGHTSKYRVAASLEYYNLDASVESSIEIFMDDTAFDDFYPEKYSQEYTGPKSIGQTQWKKQFEKQIGKGIEETTIGIADLRSEDRAYFKKSTAGSITFLADRQNGISDEYANVKGNMGVKVYNAADPNGAEKAPLSQNLSFKVAVVDDFPAVYEESTIYFLSRTPKQEIKYAAGLRNGETAAEKTLKVHLEEQSPEFEVKYGQDAADSSITRASFTSLSDYTTEQLDRDDYSVIIEYKSIEKGNFTQRDETCKQIYPNGADVWIMDQQEYYQDSYSLGYILLIDSNLNAYEVSKPDNVDIDPPVLSQYTLYEGGPQNTYDIDDGQAMMRALLLDSDGDIDKSSIELHLVPDGNEEDKIVWKVPVDTAIEGGMNSEYGGIYQVVANGSSSQPAFSKGTNTTLDVFVQLPHELKDKTLSAYITCRDSAGHSSVSVMNADQVQIGTYGKNGNTVECPNKALNSSTGSDGKTNYIVTINTSLVSKITAPARFAESGYGKKHRVAIYSPGPLELQYEDIFGNQYTQTVEIPEVFDKLEAVVTENGEGQPVSVKVWSNDGIAVKTLFFESSNGENSHDGVISADGVGIIEVYENGTVYAARNGCSIEIPITASAIPDTEIEPVSAVFYDSMGIPIDQNAVGPIEDFVTVQLKCSEDLVEGATPLTHVFRAPSKQGETYLFDFEDTAGNKGTHLVTLPWDIMAAAQPPQDNTPPQYSARVYAMRGSSYNQIGSYMSNVADDATAEESVSLAGLKQCVSTLTGKKFRVAFTAYDDSPVKLIVKKQPSIVGYATENDAIPGVEAGDMSITYDAEAVSEELYLYFADSAGNVSEELQLRFPAVDKTPPTASIEYDESEIGVIRAYLVTSEADLTVFDTALLTYDEEKGQYYYRFADNGSYTFRFSDAAGNTGLATATVAKFDTLAPEISSITWTANGKTYTDPEEIPKLALTNKAVTATVAFTKAILPEVSSEGFLPEYTTLGNRITFVYHENSNEFTFKAWAFNRKECEATLPAITCIDKTAPEVIVKLDNTEIFPNADGAYECSAETNERADLLFETNEESTSNLAKNETGTKLAYKAAAGEHALTFADAAGNMTSLLIRVVSEPPLSMQFSSKADGTGSVSSPGSLGLSGGDSIYVSVNKAADITIAGKDPIGAQAGAWTELTVPDAGTMCTIKAETESETVYAYMSYLPADNTAPRIAFASDTISVAAGVSETELHTALMQGVTVTDNRDESITPEFDASQVDTNKPGKYSVVYTARDRAGNQASASRQLVVSKTAAVLLIDGMATIPYGTMILAKGTHRVSLAGTESEPVYMSYKEGYKTIGQMKTRSNVWIANREYTGPVTVELDRGLYTLYFRTQDRSEFLVYLYVQ